MTSTKSESKTTDPVRDTPVHAHIPDIDRSPAATAADVQREAPLLATHRALYVALATAAHGAEPEVHVLGAPGEPAGSFCGRCADGDFLVDNGSLELVIGGSHRRDESFYKFRTADTLGSIVFHRFAVTGARSDIILGTPYVRVGRTTTHVRFDKVEMERSGNLVAFVANGLYRDGQRVQVQFEGC